MDLQTQAFDRYLQTAKRVSANSRNAYMMDVEEFGRYLDQKGIWGPEYATRQNVSDFLLKMKNEGKSASTVNRRLASVRCYYTFLMSQRTIVENPTLGLKAPHIEQRDVEYLTIEEVELLLNKPDQSNLGVRDRALLELLYGAGLRASEASVANVEDVNLRVGFIACGSEGGKARVIPLGRPAKAALENYIYEVRPRLIGSNYDSKKGNTPLFVNYTGERISRQGIWKILKEYGKDTDFREKLNPQILRNSFAVHMIQNGADLKTIQELLGTEDIASLRSYLSVAKTHIKDVYDKTHPRA